MPIATLLLREKTSTSLTTIVERSQRRKPPLPEYELRLNSCQLDLVPKSKRERFAKPTPTDEGFESDVDSVSIVSSDDSFTNLPENGSKTPETDSANGSTSSDSDNETSPPQSRTEEADDVAESYSESYHLVDCVCYTDVKFPDLLVFVIKGDALVFKFDKLDQLQNFYANFSALKAVTNQKAYSSSFSAKFNLLQRTDHNGITHIEITREPEARLFLDSSDEPTSIISLNTPENRVVNKKDASARQRNNSKSASSENLLSITLPPAPAVKVADIESLPKDDRTLRKVWNSAEDLLDSPKRPDRRRKPKGRAPPPPVDVMKGEYVRVSVNAKATDKNSTIIRINQREGDNQQSKMSSFSNILSNPKSKLTTYQQFKQSEPKSRPESATLSRSRIAPRDASWSNSLLRKPRSRSETRNFTPMAYRYIDTTTQPRPVAVHTTTIPINTTISNRLFGMSSKLKEFNPMQNRYEDARWNTTLGANHSGTFGSNADATLKSVIKKDDNKRKSNEKKVTFSAYTTVQVV